MQSLPVGYESASLYRGGGWIQTFSGKPFWPLNPSSSELDERDIAHALANVCRFTGHCRSFYSVAEHSVRVSLVVPEEDALWGLLHDASEAYLADLAAPLKYSNTDLARAFIAAEERLMYAVCERYDLPYEMPESVHEADQTLLATEWRDLLDHPDVPLWTPPNAPLDERISPVSSAIAEGAFLARLYELTGRDPADLYPSSPTPDPSPIPDPEVA